MILMSTKVPSSMSGGVDAVVPDLVVLRIKSARVCGMARTQITSETAAVMRELATYLSLHLWTSLLTETNEDCGARKSMVLQRAAPHVIAPRGFHAHKQQCTHDLGKVESYRAQDCAWGTPDFQALAGYYDTTTAIKCRARVCRT